MFEVVGVCPKVSDQLLSKCSKKYQTVCIFINLGKLEFFFVRNATKNVFKTKWKVYRPLRT